MYLPITYSSLSTWPINLSSVVVTRSSTGSFKYWSSVDFREEGETLRLETTWSFESRIKQVEETKNIIIDGLLLVLLVGVASMYLQNGMVWYRKWVSPKEFWLVGKNRRQKELPVFLDDVEDSRSEVAKLPIKPTTRRFKIDSPANALFLVLVSTKTHVCTETYQRHPEHRNFTICSGYFFAFAPLKNK